MAIAPRTLDSEGKFSHPLYQSMISAPGLSVGVAALDDLLAWGVTNALWVFPMATSCCGIELMATAASRVDVDRMGTIVRATPRQADVMVVAGTITVKMAPRVLRLWEQMPQPRWCIAMGSCAMTGDFYRNLYSVVPGIDTFLPVDVYIPGCPPNPEALMHGLLRLQEKVQRERRGEKVVEPLDAGLLKLTKPSVPRLQDAERTAEHERAQLFAAQRATQDEAMAPVAVPELPPPGMPLVAQDFDGALHEVKAEMAPAGPPLVPVADHLRLATRLQSLGYCQLVTVVATHFPAGKGRGGADAQAPEHYEVAYALRSIGRDSKLAVWAVRVPMNESIPTLSRIFAGADWQEREQYDLVGVTFSGHRDLRRLMMPGNWQGHPLRRDVPADAGAPPWR